MLVHQILCYVLLLGTWNIEATRHVYPQDDATRKDQMETKTAAKLKKVSFCHLVTRPDRYDKKTVRTQAILVQSRTAEVDGGDAYLFSFKCSGEDKWTLVEYAPDYAVNPEIQRAMNKLIQNSSNLDVGRINVTVVGRFEAAESGKGFGHLDGFRARFVVISLESVKPVPSNVPFL